MISWPMKPVRVTLTVKPVPRRSVLPRSRLRSTVERVAVSVCRTRQPPQRNSTRAPRGRPLSRIEPIVRPRSPTSQPPLARRRDPAVRPDTAVAVQRRTLHAACRRSGRTGRATPSRVAVARRRGQRRRCDDQRRRARALDRRRSDGGPERDGVGARRRRRRHGDAHLDGAGPGRDPQRRGRGRRARRRHVGRRAERRHPARRGARRRCSAAGRRRAAVSPAGRCRAGGGQEPEVAHRGLQVGREASAGRSAASRRSRCPSPQSTGLPA